MIPRPDRSRIWILGIASLVLSSVLFAAAAPSDLSAQGRTSARSRPLPDLTREPTLFVVGYAHLDTQWRWDFVTTIREYLPKTLRENFALLERYPHYIFNFSGSNRYRMIQEYYPQDYEQLKRYVALGRWFPAGSSVEENDVNAPSAESIFRQILYGTLFFRREFGKTSAEYMLPDCFGFPASLPSILAHAGIQGFSTQKLSPAWQPAARVGGPDSPQGTPEGIPFNIGLWEGPDGATVLAALNPGSYAGSVTYDLSKAPPAPPQDTAGARRRQLVDWPARIQRNGESSGIFADYMYYGTGDTGGSPTEASVSLLEAIVTRGLAVLPDPWGRRGAAAVPGAVQPVQVGDGPVRVISATAEDLFLAIGPEQRARLPRYRGELELIEHSAGSLTSQAYLKRWNRQNEVLADGAERASVAAAWLGSVPYPQERLNRAWILVLTGQFHDIIPGTSIPKAYEYSWNDEVLALNQFASVLTHAVAGISSGMDTETAGTPVVVFNGLEIPREDVVEVPVAFLQGSPAHVRVTGPDGQEVPAQVTGTNTVLFLARVPPVGLAVFDLRPSDTPAPMRTGLSVTDSTLENHRYRIRVDRNGDVTGVFDKRIGRELLSGPARLEIKTDNPRQWPAWNMDWEDQVRPPRAYVGGPARIRIVEAGPVRVALEVEREAEGSRFVQTIRLAAGGAGERVEIANAVDWNTREAHLKAVFPLSARNAQATYNLGLGTLERGNNHERQFEVLSHQWFDLTDRSGRFGVTILSEAKLGSDKPDDRTLRLTLLRTPGTRGGYNDQGTQDLGHHRFVYGLAGHAGDWREGKTHWQAYRLDQPLAAFQVPKHPGSLGRSFSFLQMSHDGVRVLALKKAEESDEYIVRLVEQEGRPLRDIRISFAMPVLSAREVNGVEAPLGPARVQDGRLVVDLGPYQPRTFAFRLAPPTRRLGPPKVRMLDLPFDQAVASPDGRVGFGRFDRVGRSLPAELLPAEIGFGAVPFRLGPPLGLNAVTARGQSIQIPPGDWNRIYLLAAAEGDQVGTFLVGGVPAVLTVQDWSGYIGQWDNRRWISRVDTVPPPPGSPPGTSPRVRTVEEMTGLVPGFVKPAPVAWFASHRHDTDGTNEPYAYAYLFSYALDLPPGAGTLTLPDNERIRILAATVASEPGPVLPTRPLFDTLERSRGP